jgi:6-phosphogluconolactonase
MTEPPAGTGASGMPAPNLGEPDLVVAAGPAEAAREAAERIAAALAAAVRRRGRADFCTTGGSTPVPIYRLLAASPLREVVPWPLVHVWWGDDRFVPRGHPDSNVTALDEILLGGAARGRGGVPLPAANIHPWPNDPAIAGGHDTSWSATRYAEEMAGRLPRNADNWPVFDLILVGVGDDAHLLSVFPHSAALDEMAWTMAIPAPTHVGPHVARVTVNPRLLEAAPVLVVTWGAGKAEALGHIFGEVRDERRWPAQRTRRRGAVWIVDEAAAERMPRSGRASRRGRSRRTGRIERG